MATLNNGTSGKGTPGRQNDGQKNYTNSNQRNPDNIRNSTRDHEYKEHDETLTNDGNFDADGNPKVDMDLDDKSQNVEQ